MYSVVLMAALTTGSATPDWGVKSYIGPGCYGCWGYGCYSACYGPGCHHWNNGYYGCVCSGWGGSSWGCNGCNGCNGWGCNGCSGYYGCTCSGCAGFYGSPYSPMYGGGPVNPMPPADPPMKKENDKKDPPPPPPPPDKTDENKEDKGTFLGNRARLLVEVPAGARLFIDDQPMRNTATLRTFRTPDLDRTQTYYYMVRVEIDQGGTTYREQRRVLLRAGEEIRQSFTEATVLAASRQNAAARR